MHAPCDRGFASRKLLESVMFQPLYSRAVVVDALFTCQPGQVIDQNFFGVMDISFFFALLPLHVTIASTRHVRRDLQLDFGFPGLSLRVRDI
jgi:hypothetical protein